MVDTSDQKARSRLLYTSQDEKWLSRSFCVLRAQIETFEATPADVKDRARRGGLKKDISVGQVGIRCVHCASLPYDERANGAVSYPKSIKNMYQAVRNWQRYHFAKCKCIPETIKEELGSRQRRHSKMKSEEYWVDSCKLIGMVDADRDDEGIFYAASECDADGANSEAIGSDVNSDGAKEEEEKPDTLNLSQLQDPKDKIHPQEVQGTDSSNHIVPLSNEEASLEEVLSDSVDLFHQDWCDGNDNNVATTMARGALNDPLPASFELDGKSGTLHFEGGGHVVQTTCKVEEEVEGSIPSIASETFGSESQHHDMELGLTSQPVESFDLGSDPELLEELMLTLDPEGINTSMPMEDERACIDGKRKLFATYAGEASFEPPIEPSLLGHASVAEPGLRSVDSHRSKRLRGEHHSSTFWMPVTP